MARIPESEFTKVWNKISSKSNYLSPEVIKAVYYGILKTIVADLRVDGECWMPDLGKFKIITRSPREVKHPKGKVYQMDAIKAVRFEADYKLSGYFKNLHKPKEVNNMGAQEEDGEHFQDKDRSSFL